jgi:hypothetical protein
VFRVLGFKVYFGCFIDANKFELKLPTFFFFLHTSSRWAYAMNFHPLRGALDVYLFIYKLVTRLFINRQESYKRVSMPPLSNLNTLGYVW